MLKIFASSSDFSYIRNSVDLYDTKEKKAYEKVTGRLFSIVEEEDYKSLFDMIFASSYLQIPEDKLAGTKTIVEKSNENIHFNKVINDFYPDSKWLIMVRSPMHILNSQLRKGQRSEKRIFAIIHTMQLWYQEALLLESQLPDRVKFIKYEDLVLSPADTLLAIFGFMGVSKPTADQLDFFVQNAGYTYDRSNSNRGKSIDKNSLNPKLDFSEKIIGLTENKLSFIYERFGYEKRTSGSANSLKFSLYQLGKAIKK